MRHYKFFFLLCVVFALFGYTTYNNLSEKPEFNYEYNSRYQIYNTATDPVKLPPTITFAGEKVPLHDRDVMKRFDKELHYSTYSHYNTLLMMKKANRWLPRIEAILKQYKLPRDFKYVVAVESMFENVVSPRGASGYWQLMEGTARELGLEITDEVDERFHPIKSTHAACKYFQKTYKSYGSYTSTLASYNMGISGLNKAMSTQKQKSFYNLMLNQETSRYIFKVLAIKELLEHPKKYGFKLSKKHFYKPDPVYKVKVTQSITDLSSFALDHKINYKILKQYNPWLRKNTLTVAEGKSYVIEIPKNPVFDSEEEAPVLSDSIRVDLDVTPFRIKAKDVNSKKTVLASKKSVKPELKKKEIDEPELAVELNVKIELNTAIEQALAKKAITEKALTEKTVTESVGKSNVAENNIVEDYDIKSTVAEPVSEVIAE